MRKDASIETLRGITILLVVVGHVINHMVAGQHLTHPAYPYFYDLFINIRMPLFTVISGWVYSLHPVSRGEWPVFMRKKARRLLLPLFAVGTTYFILQSCIPGTNNSAPLSDIWKIYVFPYTLYWYLPALFLLFFSVACVDVCRKMETIKQWAVVMAVALTLCLAERIDIIPEDTPNLFAFRNACLLAPFFYAGIAFHRFKETLFSGHKKQVYLALLLAGVALQQCHYFRPELFGWYDWLQLPLFIGLFSCACLIVQPYKNSFFIWLGKYAYTIYLFHAFGISATRILLKNVVGINNNDLVFWAASAVALFAPILVEKICIRWGFLRMFFLGKKW